MLLNFNITAVGFDGTLCEDKWPEIGAPNVELIRHLKEKIIAGHKIILWTCRVDDNLREALDWCMSHELEFHAVNENVQEIIDMFPVCGRKIYYDELIDDKNHHGFDLPFHPSLKKIGVVGVGGTNMKDLISKEILTAYDDIPPSKISQPYSTIVADYCEGDVAATEKVFKHLLLSEIQDLIANMVSSGARKDEFDKVIIYAATILNAEKLQLDLDQCALDNDIKFIKERYQPEEQSNMQSWAQREIDIACKRERADSKTEDGEWDYGCSCYESAYKAFKSLMQDGHSGFSINLTKHVLNRLIENKPLTPIEDTPDVWSDILDRRDDAGYTCYQNRRMSALFKYVYDDGRVRYKDIDNNVFINLENDSSWHNGIVQDICDELFPITMPYSPGSAPYKFYGEECLTNKKNGDYDTVGILYMITPGGERVKINRYFKETKDGSMKRICNLEYVLRKVLRVD